MNSNFPPSHATDPRGDVGQTKSPEVSPRAREAAEAEIGEYLNTAAPFERQGIHVQRALDAAVAEKTAILDRNWRAMYDQEVARLTKELAEREAELEEHRNGTQFIALSRELAEERATLDFQINTLQSSLSTERAAREKAENNLFTFTASLTREITRITNERESLRQKLEQTELELHEHSVFWSARDSSGEIQHYKATPGEAAHVIESLSISADSLRTQLASVTRERDAARATALGNDALCEKLSAERDELQRKLSTLETLRDAETQAASIMDSRRAAELTELQSKLAAAEQERDDARRCKPDEFSHVLASERAARSELSSLRKVYWETAEERDTLSQRVAELEAAIRKFDDTFSKRAALESEMCDEIERAVRSEMQARCEKLEKALRSHHHWHKSRRVSDEYENAIATNDYLSSRLCAQTEEALNQSPE